MALLALLIAVHVLAAVFWVGGMAFAYFVLRPAAGPLDPPVRLALWRRVFATFLPWVGASIVVLLVTGFAMMALVFGGPARSPPYVHAMTGLGILMMLIYVVLLLSPWKQLRAALDAGTLPAAAVQLNRIRILVAVNLVLGTLTLVVAAAGRYW